VQRRQPARALGVTALAMLALGFPLALMQSDAHHQPFAGYGALAWAVFVVLGVRTCCLRQGATPWRIAQFLWWLLWPSLLSLLALWGGGEADLAQGWTTLLVTVPWLLMAALSLWRWNALRWPLGAAFDACASRCSACCSACCRSAGCWASCCRATLHRCCGCRC
jgi:hypothetical protein